MERGAVVRKPTSESGAGGGDVLSRTLDDLRAQRAPLSRTERRREASRPTLGGWSPAARLPDDVRALVIDREPRRGLADLVLAPEVRAEVTELMHEFGQAALLRAHSLEPRHKLLLIGPPGNGKTSLAEALAWEAGLPFLTVRYEALLNSYLGETSNRLKRLTDYAASVPCLLFFDEFDSVGKERSDLQDVGEMKRVVGSLLVQLDAIPSHTLVVCASNHGELLDRAVWRRFDLKVLVGPPGPAELDEWFTRLARSLGADIEEARQSFIETMDGESFSQIEAFTLDIRRKLVLSGSRTSATDALRDGVTRWAIKLQAERRLKQPDGPTSNQAHRPRAPGKAKASGAAKPAAERKLL